MRRFFDYGGSFFRLTSMVADIMMLGILWLLFCMPIITIGASSTALFYVATKRLSNREGYIVKDFFQSFKTNFKTATIVWLTLLLSWYLLYINVNIMNYLGGAFIYLSAVYYFFALQILFINIFAFPLLSRFEFGYKKLMITALLMANKHLLTTIICVAVFAVLFVLVFMIPPLAIFMGSIYSFAVSCFLIKIFRKYMPEFDK